MKFLLDECVWKGVALTLASEGHDVRLVAVETPGLPDEDVLDWAEREERVLITHDRRMGHLVAEGLHAPRGLAVLKQSLAQDAAMLILPLLNLLPGHLVVIEGPDEHRVRPLAWAMSAR